MFTERKKINRFYTACLQIALLGGLILYILPSIVFSQGGGRQKGVRPYELDWAGRIADTHSPLVDFENLEGWTVEALKGNASFSRSEEQKIWDKYTGKLEYKGHPSGASYIIRPPESIPVEGPFSAINLWVWNDYYHWSVDRGKPQSQLSVLIETSGGEELEIVFPRDLDWPEWYLMHVRLNARQRQQVAEGAKFTGFRLSLCLREETQTIFFDNLSFYQEEWDAIPYTEQPRPGVDLAPGQGLGIHTAAERLPFPTREETMLPENFSQNFNTDLRKEGDTYIFRYIGDDGKLEYRYTPFKGDLSDVTASWGSDSSVNLEPLSRGGVLLTDHNEVEGLLDRHGTYLPTESIAFEPDEAELLESYISGQTVIARWRIGRGSQTAEVAYTFRIWQKSLVVDVKSTGGHVGEVTLGAVRGAVNPRLVQIPYWSGENIGSARGRPSVLVMGIPEEPLFMSVFLDFYRTGASQHFFVGEVDRDEVRFGGGSRYIPRTDGKRNDCYERIFLNISHRFDEVLPTVANPPSPWREEAAKYLVCHHGARDREADYAHWKNLVRYGIKHVAVLDHEVGWRDGAESFTFRTLPAPAKGGAEGLREYARKMQALGIRYGLYNNYTDYAPVNAFWNEDLVGLLPDGSWRTAWFRCYSPKTSFAVATESSLTPYIQDKYKLSTAYCDVHTAITPWFRVCYDARIPGAGTILSQFYAYGQLMLHQQEVWNGPAYSEGGNHYFYAGLISGSKSDDRGYNLARDPWIVDFDLRKLHPLGCDIGFGKRRSFSTEMGVRMTDNEWDRFFAGTIAFGHVGKFHNSRGSLTPLMLRSYYMLQQIQSSYASAYIKDISYAGHDGKLYDVSAAVANGAYKRSQLRLEYDNGLMVWVNGHLEETWETPEASLPPSGYYAVSHDRSLVVSSALVNGRRVDHVHGRAYDYFDGRGVWTETPWGGSDGQLIVLKNEDGSREVIPFQSGRYAVALDKKPARVMALDEDKNKLRITTGRFRGGLYYIDHVPGAISYLVVP